MSIGENIDKIKSNIDLIKKEKGLDYPITLIAVSKTVDEEKVMEAYEHGQRDFGENKVQELTKKESSLNNLEDINFHMIGYLQSNKVKYLVNTAKLIHSLDRKSLIKEMEKRGRNEDFIFNCLIQVNLAKEKSKSGIYIEDLEELLILIENSNYVKVKGLMMIAPFYEDVEKVRPLFRDMKKIYDELRTREFKNIEMKYLSMGMSHDYKVAVEEGSNMVRIGTDIFGKRVYV
ncbi:YggS family pyridoxal phosphate-dependent enzyme [Lagierella massiliensis]|uniref:YggS family pyridoxal phosphate-dependent enzyme n=1 Tax=Lagierella massiliensis TaxID=1689303 RepID=UPI0006D85CB6|nr:YggS family pyridoxal phosphate-dependent enzyme [Lagierella massiliensis]